MGSVSIQERGTAPDADRPPSVELEETTVHEVLSNGRRQLVLDLLMMESPRKLSTLAEEIAAAETGIDPPPRKKRQSAYTTLHQTHLPKLDDLDIVEYDDREKVVSLGPRADDLFTRGGDGGGADEPERTSSLAEVCATLATLGLLASTASGLGMPVVSSVRGGDYAVAALVSLIVVVAYHFGQRGSPLFDRIRARLR